MDKRENEIMLGWWEDSLPGGAQSSKGWKAEDYELMWFDLGMWFQNHEYADEMVERVLRNEGLK